MLILNRNPIAPVSPFAQMHNHLNELFDTMLADGPRFASSLTLPRGTPPMNVWEEENSFRIEAELPGYDMKDIDVTVVDQEVTIKGQRQLKEQEGATWLRRERQAGSFTRTWTLPGDIDADKAEASLRDGVLLITLPKTASALPRRISVKAGAS